MILFIVLCDDTLHHVMIFLILFWKKFMVVTIYHITGLRVYENLVIYLCKSWFLKTGVISLPGAICISRVNGVVQRGNLEV